MKNLLFLFVFLACFTACGKDDDEMTPDYEYQEPVIPEAPKISTIAFADVTDAVALYITTTSASEEGEGVETRAASETITNSLFKITGSGEAVKVQFTSEEQENVDQPQVFFIKDLSEKYIYMSYDNVVKYDTIENVDYNHYDEITGTYAVSYEFSPCWEHTQVLIKKDDGAVFKIQSERTWGDYTYDSYKDRDLINAGTELQVDYNGYVYFCRGDIMKIYTHGKEVYLTQINRDDMGVSGNWLVDQQGNVIINKDYTRLATGEFTRSPEMWGDVVTVYGDSEGFYRIDSERGEYLEGSGTKYRCWIQYCQAESPAMSWKNHIQFAESLYGMNISGIYSYKEKTIAIVRVQDLISPYERHFMKLTIYDRDRIETEILDTDDYVRYEYYGNKRPCTEKYTYEFTDQQIWRAEIETGKAELLYDYGKEYVIKSIKVKNNIVTCDAFELRRGNDVVMEIYEDKSVHLVESVNNDKIIYLERLN